MSALVSSRERCGFEAPLDRVPYEGQRRRVRLTESIVALRHGVPVPVARAMVGRDVDLTPDQLVNIRKRKPKRDLDGPIKSRIDAIFVDMATRFIRDLSQEVELASADGRRARALDPRRLAAAKASHDELAALIAEAETRERDQAEAQRRIAHAAATGSWRQFDHPASVTGGGASPEKPVSPLRTDRRCDPEGGSVDGGRCPASEPPESAERQAPPTAQARPLAEGGA